MQRNLVIQTLTSQYLADLSVRINLPTLSKKYTFLLISERNENIPGFNETKKWFENISEVGKVIRNMKLIGRDTFHFFIRHEENLELLYSFGETSHCGDVHILKDKEYIVSRNRKITFLSGDPGIGKTSTLHYLAQEYQKNNQSHWVFFIALKQYIHDLQDFDHDNSISKAVQFVAADLLKLKKLELLIFVKACNENGSVALFFDEFDALCPKAEKAFLSLILLLKETKISRIIVSSNTKHVRILEDEFLQHAITLVPLESHEKKCIILIKLQKIIEINNIEQKLRELEIEKVVSVILDSQDLDEFLNSILGIPLQLEIIEKYVFKEYILKEKLHCTNFESILFGFYDFLINYLPENFHANKIGEKVCSIQLSSDEIKIIAKDGNLLHITKKILLRKEYKNMRKVLDSILRQFNPVCRRAIADQRNIRCVKLKDNLRKGNTPQHVAASEENIEILKLLHLIDPNCLNEKNVLCQVPLHYACKKKREKSVNFLVYEANCLLNVVDDFGKSPIHYAIQNENLIILNCLLQHKTTQNSKENDECKTPLQFALEENKTEALKFLLNFGGYSFNVEDSNKSNPLHYASIIDYTKIAKRILSTDSTLLNKRNNDGATPLNLACKHDATHVVKYFLTNPECDFDTQDVAGNFPIHYASKNDNREIIEHILRGDQNMLNIRNSDGETPLSLTCVNYSFESAKCLLSYQNCLVSLGERTDIIHIATIKGNKDIIRLILEKDHTLLNKQNIDGQSPLHLACFHENIEAARCLLEYVDISVQIEDNMNRNSPIHYASMNGLVEIIELILMRDKTQINQQNGNGSTPLELACFSGKYQAVNFILSHPEFKPNLKVYDGNKLFRIAATSIYGQTIMRLLLGKFRIDPNMTNEENRTALHCAANSRNDEAIRFLLNHCKCSLSIRDTNGDTPLHIYIAAEGKGFYDKHNSTIELMKKKDPTILDIQNNVGYTPLDMAVLAKEIAICKHLIDFGANMEMIDWSQTSRSHK
ncbi:hypothetical protein B566_EDAN015668 [Ephemera danica]|nr:hypothetical protein B566_EDAN015668 [Ephemera danica]